MAPKTFYNWRDAVKYLHDMIGKNKVLAGSNVVTEDTGSGIRVHAQPGGPGGSNEYNGYFKVIKSDTGKLKIVNGADETATTCGSFTAGNSNISCIKEEISASSSGVVYINIFYDDELEEYDYEFGFSATLPSTDQEIYIPLASVDASGTPSQQWTGGAITNINGAYVS